jgi:hypothetical protein
MMHASFIATLGAAGSGWRSLVQAGLLAPPLALTRAQVNTRATALAASGTAWAEFLADTARFNGTARRLLIEGQRSNLLANARTPGSTGWSNLGLASAVAATGPDGLAGGAFLLTEDTTTGEHRTGNTLSAASATAAGQSYAMQVLLLPGTATGARLTFAAGAFTGGNAWARFDLTGGGSVAAQGPAITRATIRRFGAWYACEMVGTTAASGDVFGRLNLVDGAGNFSYTGTGRTLTVAWAQIEAAPFSSSLILPPVGSPSASTRGADIVNVSLAGLGIGGGGACTILVSALLGISTATGAPLTLLQIDDGSANNRYLLRRASSGPNVSINRVTAGVAAGDSALGVMTADTLFRVGIAVDGAGRIAGSLDGGAAVAITGGPTGGLTTLRVGGDQAATNSLFGEIGQLRLLPHALPDAALQAAVAAM